MSKNNKKNDFYDFYNKLKKKLKRADFDEKRHLVSLLMVSIIAILIWIKAISIILSNITGGEYSSIIGLTRLDRIGLESVNIAEGILAIILMSVYTFIPVGILIEEINND